MKILHVVPSLSRLRGGPTFVVKTLAAHQARAGVEVHIATTDDDDRGRQDVPLAKPVMAGGATCWYFGRTTRTYESSIGLTSWLLRHTSQFDLVHIHSVFTFPATVAAQIAWRRSIPYVVRPLGVLNRWGLKSGRAWAKRLSIRLIESGMLRRAAAVQFSSVTERAESAEACPLGRTVVIPNPVDVDAPAQRGLFRGQHPVIADRPIVLFVGRLDPVKGIELLMEAFAIVRQSNPRAVLVIGGSGDPAYVQTLRGRAQALGIANDVLWTGFLDKAAKAAALADADVFVAPSQSESFGLAAVEALAAGVPVVLSAGAGIAHDVLHAGAGLVISPDPGEIARAVERILNDSELACQLGSRAQALVRSRYRADAVAAQLVKLYAEIGRRS
jgi:glycosyltransferase involved in cell wall biosynthesis